MTQVSLTIRNGTVVTPRGRFPADILCEADRVSVLAAPLAIRPGEVDIDATGLLVFPGFIDPHVHSRDPGFTEKEDFTHSTRAAAAGGVTTICEMPNAIPPVMDVASFQARARRHSETAFVDFGLWALALGVENIGAVPDLVGAGVVGFKLFWGYALNRTTKQLVYNLADSEPDDLVLPPNNGEVLELFREIAAADSLLAAHCEDRALLESAQRSLGREIESYEDLLAARPDTAETAAVALATEFSRATGCRTHVVHISSARGVELVRRAQQERIPLSAETCPQYLTLTDADYAVLGAMMKVYPPVRRAADQDALWRAIVDGVITSVGSDHAPHTIEQKRLPLGLQPAGNIGVETIAPLMIDAMIRGRISPERLSWVLAEGTARLFRLFPRKGTILPGSDADFTLINPNAEWTIDNRQLHSKQQLSPWHGKTCRGRPVMAVLRGQIVMRDGEPVGTPRGRLVTPSTPSEAPPAPDLDR